ncbi:MAG: hypothetical protein IE931_06335 [Sphingobacteriales bacterium]|nr:hypothetical protein [Sphingobacteriales bacterium]
MKGNGAVESLKIEYTKKMGRQNGILPYVGKLGETVGYRRGKEHYTRKKTASYQPSEESLKSANEFGKGSSASALVRKAFKPLFFAPFEENLHSRLAEVFRKIMRSGPEALKGNRRVYDGNVSLLKGFECSTHAKLENLCTQWPGLSLNQQQLIIDFLPIKVKNQIKWPPKADKALFMVGFAAFDFEQSSFQLSLSEPLTIEKTADFTGGQLAFNIPKQKEQIIMVMMNLRYRSSGIINNQKFLAGAIVDAFHLKEGKIVHFEPEEKALKPEPEEPILVQWKKI